MLAEEFPEYGILGPLTLGGTSVTMHLQVDDADAVIRRAGRGGRRDRERNRRTSSTASGPAGCVTLPAIAGNVGHFPRRGYAGGDAAAFHSDDGRHGKLTRPTRLQVPDRVPPAHPKRLEPHILIAVLAPVTFIAEALKRIYATRC